MLNTLFKNMYIPIFLFIIGFIILISVHLNGIFKRNRKVTVKRRTNQKNVFSNKLFKYFSVKMENIPFIENLIDKGQFTYGYFSALSEENNREKVKGFALKLIIYDAVIVIATCILGNSIFTKVIIIAIVLLAEYMFITILITKRKTALRDEFHILIRQFIEGYVLTHNIKASFESSLSDLSPIYQVHVSRLINQLSSTTDANTAFLFFERRINYSMCDCFVSILQTSLTNNKDIVDNLLQLQSILQEDRNKEKNIKMQQASKIKVIFFWNAMLLCELLIEGNKFATATGNYFVTTSVGQTLLLCNIFAILLSLVSIKVVDSL